METETETEEDLRARSGRRCTHASSGRHGGLCTRRPTPSTGSRVLEILGQFLFLLHEHVTALLTRFQFLVL
jgi:hypothetical protein